MPLPRADERTLAARAEAARAKKYKLMGTVKKAKSALKASTAGIAALEQQLEEVLAKVDTGASAKAAEKLSAKDPFEVLVVGGGPGGVAASIYTARKGFRTGIAAERFGGQLNDTLGIENLPGTVYTEGPKLAGELKRHVGEYDIDLMDLAKAVKLVPAEQEGGLLRF